MSKAAKRKRKHKNQKLPTKTIKTKLEKKLYLTTKK